MKIILISHGLLSKGFYETAQMILGPQENMCYFGLYPQNCPEDLEAEVENKIKEIGDEEEILVLSDLFFGSPFNVAVRLMERHKFYHITGINLPLLLEIITMSGNGYSAQEICDKVIELSGSSVVDVRKQLLDVLEGE